jgi:hypothetical protein
MKNRILMLAGMTAAILTAQAAYAGGDQRQRQIGEENRAYFAAMGIKDSGKPIAQNPDYVFNTTPSQRMAVRSQAYFEKIGYKGGEVKPFNYYTDVSQYPFPGSVLSAERGGYVFSSAIKR